MSEKKEAVTVLELRPWEVKRMKDVPDDMSGGHQAFHRFIMQKLEDGAGERVSLIDAELGRLVRHMGYGEGGYQGRLRKCFGRALRAMIGEE